MELSSSSFRTPIKGRLAGRRNLSRAKQIYIRRAFALPQILALVVSEGLTLSEGDGPANPWMRLLLSFQRRAPCLQGLAGSPDWALGWQVSGDLDTGMQRKPQSPLDLPYAMPVY